MSPTRRKPGAAGTALSESKLLRARLAESVFNLTWWFSCVAVTGLGGHAFGSFKERGGKYMWLRDSLRRDLNSVRVFTYGYDTFLSNSQSFQDLEALASTFRRRLVDLRRLLPVGCCCRLQWCHPAYLTSAHSYPEGC